MKPADAAPLIRRWFDEYDRSVVTTLRRCGVRSAADCADLKQEVFTTAFFALLRGTVIDAPKAWLKACARKKASNYRVTEGRRALPARGGEAVSITPSPAQLVEDREVMLLVLACLDEELQDIVLAFRVDGLFWDEIAAERGITVDSARHQYKMAITLMTEAWKREDAKSGKRRWVPFPILLTQVFDAFRAEVDSDSPELDRRVRETLDRLMEEAGACDPDPESERVSVATLSPPTIQITLPPAPPTPGGMVLGVLGNVIVIGVFIAFLIRGTTPENPLSELTHARSIPALALFESGEEMGKGEAVAPLFPVKETRITFRKAVAPSHRDADRALATDPLNVASASLTLIDLARTAAQRGNTREGLALLAQHARDFPGKHNEALRRDLILLVCSAHEARGAADCAHP